MTRKQIIYVPSLSKKACLGTGMIQLRRNREGELYYATRNSDSFVTWHLYLDGEDWLELHGYREGDQINFSVAMHLYDQGFSYTGGSGTNARHVASRSKIEGTPVKIELRWRDVAHIAQSLEDMLDNWTTLRQDLLATGTLEHDHTLVELADRIESLLTQSSFPSRRYHPDEVLPNTEITQLEREVAELQREYARFRQAMDQLAASDGKRNAKEANG